MTLRWILLVVTGLVLLIGSVFVGGQWGGFPAWVHLTMALSVVGGFLVMAAAWTWRDHRPGRRWLLAVMLLGVVLRLFVASASWELSDDAARYHWDGKVLAHGINPFKHAPDAEAIAGLRIHPIDERINHPWNRTCYPPLAQVLFATGYLLSPGRLDGMKLLWLLCEILSWLLLARELKRCERSWGWLLLMAWSPLLIFQGYLPGHVDLFNLPLITLLILSVVAGQGKRAGLFLGLCCLVKPLPLLWLPAMLRSLGIRKAAEALAVFAVVVVAGFLPFLDVGRDIYASTWLMATDWSFNGSFGTMLEALFPKKTAHLLSGVLVISLILATTWKKRDFLASALLAQIIFVSFTPTLFPWYLVGMYPLLVLRPRPALLTLGTLVPLSDEVVAAYNVSDIWKSATWARYVQYIPFYAILIWERLSSRSRHLRFPRDD